MKAAQASWVALLITCGCLRLGYEQVPRGAAGTPPDKASADAGAARPRDAAVADAATDPMVDAAEAGRGGAGGYGGARGTAAGQAGSGGAAGRAGAAAVGSGGGGASGAQDAGAEPDPMLGTSGLHVSEILGFYSSDWGDMVLRKYGDELWGVYQYDGGTIVGQITTEGVFVGWWSQLPSRTGLDAGEVEFRWSRGTGDVIELDGRWRYGNFGDWLENWDPDLVTDRDAPTSLTDRFNNPEDFKAHP